MSSAITPVPLGTLVARVIGGGTPARSVQSNWEGRIPWASVKDLQENELSLSGTQERISERALSESAANLVPAGVPIVCTRMAVGRVAMASVDTAINQDLKALFPASRTDPRFLLHGLRFLRHSLEAVATGSTVKGLQVKDLLSFKLFCPELDEQRRIAEILDALDNQIHAARRLQAKLQAVRMGMLDSCAAALDSQALRPLSEVCSADICYGIVQSGPFISQGVSVLAIRDLDGDFVTGVHRTSRSIEAQYRRSRVSPGDVLLSIKGTIGRVGVVPEHYSGNISREIGRLRFSRGVDPMFARQYLTSRSAQRRLDLSVVGTTRAEISIHVLKKFGFPVPDLAVQQTIVAQLASVEARIAAEASLVTKLSAMQFGLTESLMSGRVRLSRPVAA